MIFIMSLVFILIFISLGSYISMKVIYSKYNKVKIKSKLSGFEVSRTIMDSHNLNNVYITETREFLFSKYDFGRKVVRLVKNVFNGETITSTAISSLESSYAILDKKNNNIYNLRKKITPIINLLLILSYIIILIGFLFGHMNTLLSGIIIDYLILIIYILTYSVEIECKKIALKELVSNKIVNKKEIIEIEKVLKVALLTNFASIFFPLVEVLKKIIDFGKSN